MALATRPKPRVQHRKRVAQHHHHGPGYLKTYWPYLPMLIVIGSGVVINKVLYQSMVGSGSVSADSTRLQAIVGNQSSWIATAAVLVTAAIFGLFVITHWRRVHKFVIRGEAYVISHPWLEISAVFLFTTGFVLTRFVGGPHA